MCSLFWPPVNGWADPCLVLPKRRGKPAYYGVFRKEWTGEKHVAVFGALRALAQTWRPMKTVMDATGVGEGLWSLMDNAVAPQVTFECRAGLVVVDGQDGYSHKAKINGRTSASTCSTGGALETNGNSC